MRDITLMPNDYIVTHIKTDTICEHFSNDDVVYAVDERIVPLVRCKECVDFVYDEQYKCYGCATDSGLMGEIKPDDFCSHGKRRDE